MAFITLESYLLKKSKLDITLAKGEFVLNAVSRYLSVTIWLSIVAPLTTSRSKKKIATSISIQNEQTLITNDNTVKEYVSNKQWSVKRKHDATENELFTYNVNNGGFEFGLELASMNRLVEH